MGVDILVVSFNTRDLLASCLESIDATCSDVANVTTFVIDNASSDGSAQMVRERFPAVRLIELQENIGFGPANNRGLEKGQAEFVLLLNSDATLTPGALAALVSRLDGDPTCVAVGPRLRYPDGRYHQSCRNFPSIPRSISNALGLHSKFPNWIPGLRTWLPEREHVDGVRVDMVSMACVLIRRSHLERVGRFDEHLFLYEEEADVFLPTRHTGEAVCYCAEATVIHHHGASSGEKKGSDLALLHLFRSKYYVYRKHFGRFRAWMLYASDQAIFNAANVYKRFTGADLPSERYAHYSREGWRRSRDGESQRTLT